MADPTLVLLILIGASAADRPHAATVGDAIGDALGGDARILTEERSSALADAEAASVADGVGGSAVAEIAWSDGDHTHARLHVYLSADRIWYDRDVSFEPDDAPAERERAIGFLVGTMIRETAAVGLSLPVRPPAVTSQPLPAAAPRAEVVVPPAPREATSRLAVDFGGVATSGIEGAAPSLGPLLRGHVTVGGGLSLHAGGSMGFGSIDAADARMMTSRLVGGARWTWWTVARGLSFDVGLDALAVNHAVQRADPAADRDRWLAGAHADVGVGWRASDILEPFATGGLDAVGGSTPITVGGSRVTQIPPFRATVELGLKTHF